MDFNSQPPGRHLHFSAALAVQLRRSLGDYCAQSGVLYAALLEEGGTLCADSGDDSLRDSGETAALAVGAFAAFRLVAERLGDEGFEGLLHEGPRRQFSLMPVTSRFLLLSVFQPPVRFAVVKICAKNVITRLSDPLELLALSSRDSVFPEHGTRDDSAKSDSDAPAQSKFRTAPAAAEDPARPVRSSASADESPPLPPSPTAVPPDRPSTSSGRASFETSDWVLGPESHFPWD